MKWKFTKTKSGDTRTSEERKIERLARKRVRQKKWLYQHALVFLPGSLLFFALNMLAGVGGPMHWYPSAIAMWAFLLSLHALQVFVFSGFMGQDWEKRQREALIEKQKKRIAEIQKEIETEFPLSKVNKSEAR